MLAGTVEILHRSNPTVENAQATWPHQKPEAAFIAHRLLLDNLIAKEANEDAQFVRAQVLVCTLSGLDLY